MKKRLKALISIILTLTLLMSSITVLNANAAVYYDRTAAVNYAKNHWNDGVGLCAQFVSACISAGGLSVSQNVCLNLWNTLKNYGTPYKLTSTNSSGNGNIKLSANTGKVEAGDPLFYVCETCGGTSGKSAFPHVVFCGGTDSSGYLTAYAHNSAWNNKKVWTKLNSSAHSGHTFSVYSIHINGTSGYTMSYNANGGIGAPSSQSGAASYTISSTKPTKKGYTFLGWATSSSAASAAYAPGDKISLSSNTTLYAVWKVNTLKVYFNVNGGIITSDTYKKVSDLVCYTSDSSSVYETWAYNNPRSHGLTNIKTFGLTREGYTFVGWGTTTTGGTIFDQNNHDLVPTEITSSINNGDCEITLYAIWRANTLNVYYHPNGGIISSNEYTIISDLICNSSDSSMVYQTWSYNSPHSHGLKNVKTFGLAKEGCTFVGWGTTTNGETIFDQNNHDLVPTEITSSINNGDCEITLYAIWQKNAPVTYTLSYNANGGNGAPASQSDATNYIVSNTQPTRGGYTFLGWSKSSSATTASYRAGDSITLTTNTTLYAVWQKNAVVPTPVEFPEIKINRTLTNKINFGDTLILTLNEVEIPEGYAIAWFVEGAGVSTWVSEDGLECRVTSIANGNPTIYAKLVDEEDNVITNADGEEIFDEITLTSKAGFWQKFISFFKNLFGINRVIY